MVKTEHTICAALMKANKYTSLAIKVLTIIRKDKDLFIK